MQQFNVLQRRASEKMHSAGDDLLGVDTPCKWM